MNDSIAVLAGTAASLGFIHTILGPDHYLPFIVISRARRWTMIKTGWITFLCGIGHVMSSMLIGIIGIAIGVAVNKLEFIEGFRGEIAAWLFISFGFAYCIWGIWRIIKNKKHKHSHLSIDNSLHTHHNQHDISQTNSEKTNITPWILFLIFVFGPCEVLIPFLMVPASELSTSGMVLVASIFGIVTIATMMLIVMLTSYGLKLTRLGKLEKYTHVIAGATILFSGLAIQVLGL